MLQQKLGLDEKDVLLFSRLMNNPDISQSELAAELKLSQPSVHVRLRKLKSRGILCQALGLDAKRSGVALTRVDFTCTDADHLLGILKRCSFFVNGFLMSGTRNVSIFLVAEDLGKVEQIVKQYLRSSSEVSNIEVSVVVDTAKEFICAVDLDKERHHACADPSSCAECSIFKDGS